MKSSRVEKDLKKIESSITNKVRKLFRLKNDTTTNDTGNLFSLKKENV